MESRRWRALVVISREASMTNERIEKLLKAEAKVILTTTGIDDMAFKMEKHQLLLASTESSTSNAHIRETWCGLPVYFRDKADHNAKLDIFKDTPFLSLLRARHHSKFMPVCKFLLGLYDADQKAFSLHCKSICLCIEEAGLLLGLKNEGDRGKLFD
ncbi:hypothetical protein RND81_12G048300 [Saponaria officinalis]|uniref:Uncharacterized protein n=1 Tax=Saponaria officinalis TaxID=3572 RepID=A0AAW1H5N6_SAPOF